VWSHVGGDIMRKVQTAAMAHLAEAVTAAQAAMRNILDSELNSVRESGTWKSERIIVTSQGPSICVEGRQQPVLNFCANNYLGLSVSRHSLLCAHIASTKDVMFHPAFFSVCFSVCNNLT